MTESKTTELGELIRLVQEGEQRAFQQIARQHSEPLFRSALALCHDRHLAEDLAQETLIEAWRSIERFDSRCRFSTWLYGILRHRYLKARQRASKRITMESPPDCTASDSQFASGPTQYQERAEDAARLQKAVANLPIEHRQVIELRFFADAKLEDISAALDIPLGTVKSRLHNALEKLRQLNLSMNLFSTSGES